MTAGTADKAALYWYVEPSVLTHRSWCGDYTHTQACTRTTCTQHSHEHMQPHTHTTLTHTHAAMHACNTHTHGTLTRTHARMHAKTSTPHDQHTLSRSSAHLHVHAHTSSPDRHIHNQVIPTHGLEPCRACVNFCLSDLSLCELIGGTHKEHGQFN